MLHLAMSIAHLAVADLADFRRSAWPSANAQVPNAPCATLPVSQTTFDRAMLLSKEYVGYLARESPKSDCRRAYRDQSYARVTEKVHASMLEELSLEDRINVEVRVILEAYSEECGGPAPTIRKCFAR